jgi:hypothetical protein
MASNKDEITAKLDKEHALEQLQIIQRAADYKLVALTRQSLLRAATKRIPWLSRFIQNIDDTGDAIVKIGDRVSSLQEKLQDTPGSQTIGHAFHFGTVGMAAFDFLRVPFIYLAAYILGEEVPINLNNNARWLYSGVLLTLAIISLTVPVTATVIGFVGASLGLAVGVFLLGKTLYERYQLGREKKKIERVIDIEEEEMLLIQQEAEELEKLLKEAREEEEIIAIYQEIAVLRERYISQHALLEELKNKELHLTQKIEEVGIMQVVDKGIGVCLSSLTIIGLALSLFFPTVGLGILTGVAIAGGIYLAARLTAPLFQLLANWVIDKVKGVMGTFSSVERLGNENILNDTEEKQQVSSLGLNAEVVKSDAHVVDKKDPFLGTQKDIEGTTLDSTAGALVGLKGEKAIVDPLQSVEERSEKEMDAKRVSRLFKPTPTGKQGGNEPEEERDIQESP